MDYNALAVASHACVIVILSATVWRYTTLPEHSHGAKALRHGLMVSVAIAAAALIIERSFYVIARLLVEHGYDLWQLHPAPQVLSAIVAAGLYCLSVPMIAAMSDTIKETARHIAFEVSGLVGFWLLIAWALQ
ncbi:MAG: hypothetical protein AAF727_06215 [Pseudomonadota bacterium]